MTNEEIIKSKKLFLFDMDGTIYNENKLFDGTIELMNEIIKNGGRYVFITNNSSKSIYDYIKKINDYGIKADYDNFYTSTQATIAYLKENYDNKNIYCMGTKSLIEELEKNNIKVFTQYNENIDVVLLGFDRELKYSKLEDICKIFSNNKNIPYIATNPDFVCPVNYGFVPDCGAMSRMLEYAIGRLPTFIGKPEPTMINYVIKKFGYTKEETVAIGDRLYTDIASGINAGITTICVLTGEATIKDIETSNFKPEIILDSVKDIYNILQN